jgi:hypothetical protein
VPDGAISVKGLRELNSAFGKISADLRYELRGVLAEAGEPVRTRAESLAQSEIRNIGDHWSRMRLGVTTSLVYVAPMSRRRRGAKSARPNLAPLLMDRAMQPALEQAAPEVYGLIDVMLGRLSDENGF